MALLSVVEAAERAGLSVRRVQELLAGGRLPAMKIAGVWLVDPADVRRLRLRASGLGRPLPPAGAWALLDRLEAGRGLPVYRGSGVCRDRGWLVNQVSRRAGVHRFRCLAGLLDELAAELVASGESAGDSLGFGLSGTARRVDGYVREDETAGIVERYRLKPAVGDDLNVTLRSVPDGLWPFSPAAGPVSDLVAAVDIAGDPYDDRALEIAGPIIDKALAA